MKRIAYITLAAYLCILCTPLTAKLTTYGIIDPVQEKIRITLKQIHATFTWIDALYAARERFYLSGIALEYIGKQKEKYKANKESYAILEQLEAIAQQLHCLNLTHQNFEAVQCKAQKLIAIPLFADPSRPSLL